MGVSALRRAVWAGKIETAALLASHGALDDSTDVDRLIGACWRADQAAAERLLAEHPDLRNRLTADDHSMVVEAAGTGHVAAVALMLELGFSVNDRDRSGQQPLRAAAYNGNAEVVKLLLDSGAEVDARDARFDATPLAFATVGSGERDGRAGNWSETVRLLIQAGATRRGVWISEKAPSEEVADLLRTYDISPDASEPEIDNADDVPRSIGTGVMAEVAQHLEAAYQTRDLELLGSLLHP